MNRAMEMTRRRAIRMGATSGWSGMTIAAVLLLLTSTWTAQAQAWQNYRYPVDGFSAAFPSAPTEQTRNIETQAGTIDLHGYMLELDPDALYIGVCDYGPKAKGGDVDKMLESAKDGALQNSRSHLIRESKISLGAYRGVEFESEGDGAHFIIRIYIVGTAVYQVLVAYPVAQPYPGAKRFLDSFQLIGGAGN